MEDICTIDLHHTIDHEVIYVICLYYSFYWPQCRNGDSNVGYQHI